MTQSNLLIGTIILGESIYLDFLGSANSHALLLGASGYGKSYAIQILLDELAISNNRFLILDIAGNLPASPRDSVFLQNIEKGLHIRNVVSDGCGINLFTPLCLDNGMIENVPQMASRIVDSLHPILRSANVQEAILYKYIKKLMMISSLSPPSLERLCHLLNFGYEVDDKLIAAKVADKLQRILDGEYFKFSKGKSLFMDCNYEVLRLHSIPQNIQRVLCDIVLWNVWSNAVSSSTPSPTFIVIDEFQNVDMKPDSPLYKILCEGRKFGLNLILATQTLKKKYDSSIENTILQVGTKILFRPPEREARYIAEILSSDKKKIKLYEDWLSSLNRGTAIVKGNLIRTDGTHISVPKKVQFRSLTKRVC